MSWKKIATLLSLMCAAVTSFGQVINGIGEFKIGMSVDEFLDLPIIREKNLTDKMSFTVSLKTFPNEKEIWKTSIDSRVDEYERVYSADIVKFELTAGMGVPKFLGEDSYKTTVKFYKSKLTSVYVREVGLEFERILTAKYGQPVKEDRTKHLTCQNGYGAKSTHLDGVESTNWGKGKRVTATLTNVFYDCGKRDMSYTVADESSVKIIDQIHSAGRKALEAETTKTKAGASKL
jgi:hypothetical protein